MKHNLIHELSIRPVLGDGAMGTRLFDKGADPTGCFDQLNLTNPGLVAEVHAEYLAAGAEVLETNTFGANAVKLEAFGLGHLAAEINARGAELAREAAGDRAWVAGSMGPLGRLDEPLPEERVREVFAEQARALAGGGVDVIILETFPRLDMLLTALAAVRGVVSLPVITQLVFAGPGGSLGGPGPERALKALAEAGADVVGFNCGLGPKGALDVLGRAGHPGRPVSVFPNAGHPERVDDRLLYGGSPEYFARACMRLVQAGARLVGGCCGTGPAHVAALAELLREARGAGLTAVPKAAPVEHGDEVPELPQSGLAAKLARGRKMLLVELDPPRHLDAAPFMEAASALARAGVDAVTVAENPLGSPRLSNTVLAGMIRRQTGAEVLVHMTGRDRNLVGMQATIMGLAAQGLQNVLAVTGDPPTAGTDEVVKGVFDLRSYELIELFTRFNSGRNQHGESMRLRPNFAVGAAFNPNTKNPALQVSRMREKAKRGAAYFLTQPVYTIEKAVQVLELTAPVGAPVFLGVMPLASSRNAEYLHNEFPGISIPDDIRARMREAGDRGQEVGVEVAWELIEYAWDKFAGVYLIPPFNRYKVALEILARLDAAGLRRS
ncbi:bifunctional homocysteine S-methyltransferase/methylenetetrahydrofolate reductase [Desulfocurvus sp. DL9XJH121]